MQFDVATVVVAAGATLAPPADWTGCPAAWSPQCPSPGGGTTNQAPYVNAGPDKSGAPSTSISLDGTVTDDGLPSGALTQTWTKVSGPGTVTFANASAVDTTATFSAAGTYVVQLAASDGSLSSSDTATITVGTSTSSTTTTSTSTPTSGTNTKVAMIVGNAASIPPKDVATRNRLVSNLGRTVTLIDDDNLASSTVLGDAGLVVVSSSVVPTKIPSWLATVGVPLLDAEAYVQTTLRLATSGKEEASKTTLRVVNASHPLAAGKSGDVAVQSSFPMAVGYPVASAAVIARIPGASTASIYGIEAGAALTTGTAPARRVGFFFSYDSPPALTAAGWSFFDAAVTWLTPATTTPPPPPPPTSGWAIAEDRYRIPVTVGVGATPRLDRPAVVSIDFGAALQQAGVTGAFGPNTVRVVEVDGTGTAINGAVPFQFDPNPGDADTGELVLLLTGTSAANATRRFHVYFDLSTSSLAAASVAPLVTTTDNITDEGQASVRVATQAGTWYLHKAGGGFSSLVDPSGQDWLGYSTAAGSAGAYRGIPNAVHPAGHFHPGATTSVTQIVKAGPLRTRVVSTTTDGKWQMRYDVFPRFVDMTMTKADHAYWFLYEGTPGGQIDQTSDVVIRADGTQTPLSESWTGDLAGDEWSAFADTVRNRSLYVAHHSNDSLVDSYWLMQNAMTVFGFGRMTQSNGAPAAYLTGVHTMTMGLSDTETHATVAPVVRDAMRPLTTSVGSAQTKPA
jgi:hypothetical protein